MSWWQTVLDGMLGSIAAALLALLGVYLTLTYSNKQKRMRNLSGAGAFSLLSPEGTFFIENKTDEGIKIDVFQKRLYENVSKVKKDDSKVLDEIYRKISIHDDEYFFETTTKQGSKKLDRYHLSNFERTEVPNCEMFGYIAENITCVIISTVIRYRPMNAKGDVVEKLYVHRFVMGVSQPDPKARWVSIYSQIKRIK